MKLRKQKMTKWKIYSALIALIAVVTFGFTALTTYIAYPTAEHRKVGQELARQTEAIYSAGGGANLEKIYNSKEYKELQSSNENVYTVRMGIGSGVLSAIISVAIVVALYRYLRRNRITQKPIGATVLINTIAAGLVMIPSMYSNELITGIKTTPLVTVMLFIALPFAIAFSALITYIIARITEWHYNRSHGFIEE